MARPAVSVILPFYGDALEADRALAALGALRRGPGDELLAADNTETGVLVAGPPTRGVNAFRCSVARSAYAARNIAAERARNDWLLFLDGDVTPRPDLLDRYFDRPLGDSVGAAAGQVLGEPDQSGFVPRYIRARRHLDQVWLAQDHPHRPMAVTANLLVRRAAWEALGGFAEGTRSGADADFCWRLQDGGWELELRTDAWVHHHHREDLPALLRQTARDGAGQRWLHRRHPGVPARPALGRELVRAVLGAIGWPLLGDSERGAFKAIDGLQVLAATYGSFASNAALDGREPVCDGATVLFVDEYPALGDSPPPEAVVEARRRPARQNWTAGRRCRFHHIEDDGPGVRLAALLRLLVSKPSSTTVIAARAPRRALQLAPAALRLATAAGPRLTSAPERVDDARLATRMARARNIPSQVSG